MCPLWRSLSRRFLLEEIWIDGHGVESLEDLLERDDGLDGNRLGSLVRCARIQSMESEIHASLRKPAYRTHPRTLPSYPFPDYLALLHRSTTPKKVRSMQDRHRVSRCKDAKVSLRSTARMSPFHWRDISVPDCVVRSSCLRTLSLRGKIYWGTKILEGKIRTLDCDCSSWSYIWIWTCPPLTGLFFVPH